MSIDKNSAKIRWTAPRSDGGSPINNYRIEMRTAGGYRWDVVNPHAKVTDTTYTVPNLLEETDYEFRVSAENKAGVSGPSQTSRSGKFGRWTCPSICDLGLKHRGGLLCCIIKDFWNFLSEHLSSKGRWFKCDRSRFPTSRPMHSCTLHWNTGLFGTLHI